ncbi:MAG: ZIP family metal transporter [Bacteroidia bacterium]|nr:ZIP family metal transporter [Bacteroidia bacterium]
MTWYYYLFLFVCPLTGGLIALNTARDYKDTLKIVLAFSGSFLFAITVLGLIPEIYSKNANTGIYVLAGFFLQILLEKLTQGVEHGHMHSHLKSNAGLFIGLSMHAFLEGIPVGGELLGNDRSQSGLIFGIGLHEIPAAFALIMILRSSAKFKGAMLAGLLCFYAMMSPLGCLTGSLVKGGSEVIKEYENILMALVIGTFLHISTTILFENSVDHKIGRIKLIAIAIGAGLALLII